ncbi:glutamyl-tRNA(Gln) amidotransferase subunit B, mitochondrial isoform X1 [Rhipicephalus microplus]|uniref:glutamyl-tRNA(Gln) amidotransferase subunit B, mitochondrial isoform X1 n=1 Tax=Rhipicephalus microplus TaxID=6941 RepID=UPI003F6BB913
MSVLRRSFFGLVQNHRCFSLSTCTGNKPRSKLKEWESVVGIEVHVQIASKSKLFSNSPYKFGAPQNSQVSPFDASIPGTLPVLNRRCVEAAVLTALALNCDIHTVSHFDRKHYFYADMPAGYQITQQRSPLATGGYLDYVVFIPGSQETYSKRATMIQLQLEQDSGKSLHDIAATRSFIDLNRAGVGLMELVFDACLKNGEEAASLVKELLATLRTLNVCSGKMEEGALRVDANVSVNRPGEPWGTRTEVKNLNSVRAVAYAVDFEIARQIELLSSGGKVVNTTMSFDSLNRCTVPMRDKEVVQDYRFMPEPNLPPLVISLHETDDQATVSVEKLRSEMPILPWQHKERLMEDHGLTPHQAQAITNEDGFLELFLKLVSFNDCEVKHIVNWLLLHLLAQLNKADITLSSSSLDAARFHELLILIQQQRISNTLAQEVLQLLVNGDTRTPTKIIEENNWWQITDIEQLTQFCQTVINENPKDAKKAARGKERVLNSLMTKVNALSNSRAQMKIAKKIMSELLDKLK